MPKKKGQKPNANEAQLRKSARQGMDKTMVYCLTVLADKNGFSTDELMEFIVNVAYVADSVKKRYVKYDNLRRTLIDEKGLVWGEEKNE